VEWVGGSNHSGRSRFDDYSSVNSRTPPERRILSISVYCCSGIDERLAENVDASARMSSTRKTVTRGPIFMASRRPALTHAQSVERPMGSGPCGRFTCFGRTKPVAGKPSGSSWEDGEFVFVMVCLRVGTTGKISQIPVSENDQLGTTNYFDGELFFGEL
jgi:hypothetical protein